MSLAHIVSPVNKRIQTDRDGWDEGDSVTGRGWATLDGDALKGHLCFHVGHDSALEATRVLATSLDGANVLINEPGAKRGRPAERPQGSDGLAPQTAYRNAMVGSISFYGAVQEGHKGPQRLACRYTSHMPEDRAVTFKRKFEAELDAAERHAPPGVVKVLVCDGARSIWNYIWNYIEQDLGARAVLHSMNYYETIRALSNTRRDDLAAQRTFFERNPSKMTYADFRRRGLPIGSGPVEAACKTLVKTRLCRSGMRWSREGGQRILELRTYVKSNRWDAFWKLYNELPTASGSTKSPDPRFQFVAQLGYLLPDGLQSLPRFLSSF
jgi:hypothetical protein